MSAADKLPVLQVRDLRVEFATPAGPARAVEGVSFALHKGMRLGLVGESGSGKSTTVLALMQLIKPPGRISGGQALLVGDDLYFGNDRLPLVEAALARAGGMRLVLPGVHGA